MMPTFPRPPPIIPHGGFSPIRLEGWHVGQHLPTHDQLKPAPGIHRFMFGLCLPFAHLVVNSENPALCRAEHSIVRRLGGGVVLRPRGPRSCPSYAVSNHHHLIDPIRPTRGHIAISPHSGLAYTQCLRCAGAPRRPAGGSGLSLTILSWHAALYDPGELDHRWSRLRCRYRLRRDLNGS